MKKLILSTGMVIAAFIFSSFSTTDYQKKMEQTIAKMYSSYSVDAYLQVANQFAVIGKAEPDEWLPWYYHANANIILIYMDVNADFDKKQIYLKKAEKSLNMILEKFPKESEIQVMNAFYAVSNMAIDPANAATFIPRYSAAVPKAFELEPENPRARFFKLASNIGEAQFFGKPTDQYCEQLNVLNEEWDLYEPKSTIHPRWGKDEVTKKMTEIGCQQ